MAEAALDYETIPSQAHDEQGDKEVYANAVSRWYALGRVAVSRAMTESGNSEKLASLDWSERGVWLEAEADYLTSVVENLATDKNFSRFLDVERSRPMQYQDGKVITADGVAMVDIVESGATFSDQQAKSDIRMQHQAVRDEGDVQIAKKVDALRCGEMLWTVSACPDDALKAYPRTYGKLGYRRGLWFVQTYYRSPDGSTVTSSSFSVGAGDDGAWRRVQQRYGVSVPAGTNANEWIRFSRQQYATPKAASSFAAELRDSYYAEIGQTHRRYSVSEFVERNKTTVDRSFRMYMLPLAKAVYTGKNNDVMRGFADALLKGRIGRSLNAQTRNELERVSSLSTFTAASGRTMESLVRYALVEELRVGLERMLSGKGESIAAAAPGRDDYEAMNTWLAQNVETGVSAGRTYGGCAALELQDSQEQRESQLLPQDVYGGKSEWKKMTCPFCHDPNQYGDPCSPNQSCHNCGARVRGGKVVSKGDGGRRSRVAQKPLLHLMDARQGHKKERLSLFSMAA